MPVDNMQFNTLSTPGGMIGAGIGNFMGNMFNNPASQYAEGMQPGMQRIDEATRRATGYLQPWQTAGQTGLTNYMDMLKRYQNPEEMYNNIMGGWKMSQGTQSRLGGAMDALKNSMAARGMMGSGQEMKDIGKTYEDYAAQDQQQYLNNILGIGQTGLQGNANLSQWGQNAGTNMGGYEMQGAQDITSMMNAIAAAQAAQAANENKENSDLFGGIGSIVGKVAKNIPGLSWL